ncbi:MAG: hydroxyacylglutathione hydrolase, partial [Desulfobacterales bacterium]
LFGGGCGRLFEGSAEQMFESLTRITELFDPGTKIYPGHEYTLANLEFAHALEPENHTVRDRLDWEKQKKKQNACRPDFDLALEKRTNPFLRSHAPDLQAAIQRRDKGVGDAPVDIFRVIRSLKDNV